MICPSEVTYMNEAGWREVEEVCDISHGRDKAGWLWKGFRVPRMEVAGKVKGRKVLRFLKTTPMKKKNKENLLANQKRKL